MPEGENTSRLAARQAVLVRNADWMRDYMKSFYNEDEEIQHAMLMKEAHTGRVRAIIRDLAVHLGLSEEDVALAEIMGLLHDVGRFRQFTVYRTFKDHLSEDHAAAGLKLMEEHGLLDGLLPWEQSLVRFAVEWHNKKEIAPAPDACHLGYAKMLRDADKLDIYHVLEPFLPSKDGSGVSPNFIEKFVEGVQCDYTMSGTEDVHAESPTVTPSSTQQVVVPGTGYNYLAQVTVEAIPYTAVVNEQGGLTYTIGSAS